MEPEPVSPSIFLLMPLEYGGVEARAGFAFQDHAAAGFCLDMLRDDGPNEVWCETLDDITLIWQCADSVSAEFVQVKSSELSQLWTVAKLCERTRVGSATTQSIFEKSLGHDRCAENCTFRLVTARPVTNPLKVLTLPRGAPGRVQDAKSFAAIHSEMKTKVEMLRSPNGHDFTFWTERTYWDVRHTETALSDANFVKLAYVLDREGLSLVPDQLCELYSKLLRKVWDASRADPRVSQGPKRIKRPDLKAWILEAVSTIWSPAVGTVRKLKKKMQAANLPSDVVDNAVEQLRYFRNEQLQSKYMMADDQQFVQAEVTAVLQSLKSKLDGGMIPDQGVIFHQKCLAELEKLRNEMSLPTKPSFSFLQGAMYSVTGRCLHRFRRVTA